MARSDLDLIFFVCRKPVIPSGVDRNPINQNRLPAWEEHFVVRAQAGDTSAFEMLVDMHRGAVYAQALRMLRDREDAQDAVQDTFLKACRAIRGFQSGRPMLPWLLRICSNCCVDIIRGRKSNHDPIETHEHVLFDTTCNVDDELETTIGSETLRGAIKRLPSRYRDIVVMRHYRHMDVNEIAESLGKPEGTIKSWLFRARALLRKDLSAVAGSFATAS